MDKPQSQYNMLARKVLIAAESGEASKFKSHFTGRQPDEIKEALTDLSQERYNEILGNVRFTPLIAGAWHGHQEVVDVLVKEYKMDINQVGYITLDGRKREVTALCAAIRQERFDIAQNLIELGADLNVCSPLSIACNFGRLNAVRFLIKSGADVNARIDEGTTCLMVACEQYKLYVVRILLNNNADPRLEDNYGNTALHRIALRQRNYALKNGPLPQIIDTLINAGARLSKNQAGQTPLDVACVFGNMEVARILMCLPEVRPEEQLTAQSKLREKIEDDYAKRRHASIMNGEDYTEKFVDPHEQRVRMRKSRSVAEKMMDMSDLENADMVNGINGMNGASIISQ